jgi:NTE family protein
MTASTIQRDWAASRASSDVALVLSGGGARTCYQVGVLTAIAERMPEFTFPIITGVSAGAINAAFLAAHPLPLPAVVGALRGAWLRLTSDRVYRVPTTFLARWAGRFVRRLISGRRAGRPVIRGLLDLRPLREFLNDGIDFAGVGTNLESGWLRAVALTATSYSTGQSVTFFQGPADVPGWERPHRIAVRTQLTVDHVMASSAIPILFPAVRLGDSFFGDGSVRQTMPLAPAIHLGARRILAISMRERWPDFQTPAGAEYPSAAEVMTLLFNSIFMDQLDMDAERLERTNRLLELALPRSTIGPDGLRPVDLLMIRPSRDLRTLWQPFRAPRLPRMIEWLLGSVGAFQQEGFLSYVVFEPEFTGLVMELGYQDAIAQWETIERFLVRDPKLAGERQE